jgi:uncharacterized protein
MRFVGGDLSVLIIGTSVLLGSGSAPRAAEFGTRAEAIAMVHRVQEKFKKDGPQATFNAINNSAPEFKDRDLFPFVLRLDGKEVVAIPIPAIRGKNTYDLKDQDGKFQTQELVRIANTPPYHGWSDYRFFNPKTNAVEEKSSWIERMGDYFVGVGIYRNEQPNENTVGVISGSPNSDDTYLQMANDLAEVLNDSDHLRIMPIVGIGGPQNIRDVRYLKGVDIGLTQTNILNSFRRSNERMSQAPDNKIAYIAKLFNEEVHLVAKPNVNSIEQLRGLKVNLDAKGSGTSYSMRDLFKTFGVEVEEVSMSQLEALEKVESGEIAATALIAGKPVRAMSRLTAKDGLHFVPIPYPAQIISDYLPATLTHDDYPELIAPGQAVDTIAVGAVLIAYDWPKNVDRYRRVQRFVEAFFSKIAEFQKPPRHVKWREVNVAATLPGWPRLPAAQQWLDNQRRQEQVRTNGTGQQAGDSALFQEFMRWRQHQGQ